jgi:hypothetical protein
VDSAEDRQRNEGDTGGLNEDVVLALH